MRVSVARSPAEARDKHVRAECANHAYHVAQRDVVSSPLLKGLFRRFREAEIGYAREALLDSVVFIGCQKLHSAQDSKLVGESVTRFVLSTLAARQRA